MKGDGEIIIYNVRFDVWIRRDGSAWLAWCPGIDVRTQSGTRKGVLEALREAVQLWFESCIERSVLDAALKEAGVEKFPPGEEELPGSDFVQVQRLSPDAETPEFRFSLDHRRDGPFIEGVIPACMTARQLDDSVSACC